MIKQLVHVSLTSSLYFLFISQNATLWTAWCQRPSSGSSWRPSAITLCSWPRVSEVSVSSSARPSASQWPPRASAASWASSWSRRCLLASSRTVSWGSAGQKVGVSNESLSSALSLVENNTPGSKQGAWSDQILRSRLFQNVQTARFLAQCQ